MKRYGIGHDIVTSSEKLVFENGDGSGIPFVNRVRYCSGTHRGKRQGKATRNMEKECRKRYETITAQLV